MVTYDFEWTASAKTYALVHRVEADILIAMMRNLNGAVPDGEALDGATSIEVGDQLFIGTGKGDGRIVIDTARWVEGPMLESGPFKGRTVMIPQADTKEDKS